MAYDQHAQYQPPPRMYHMSQSRPVPAEQGYNSSHRNDSSRPPDFAYHRSDSMDERNDGYKTNTDMSASQLGRPSGNINMDNRREPYRQYIDQPSEQMDGRQHQWQHAGTQYASHRDDGFNRGADAGMSSYRDEPPVNGWHDGRYGSGRVNGHAREYGRGYHDQAHPNYPIHQSRPAQAPHQSSRRDRAREPRATSPKLMSWDNPFPVFPGAKKRNPQPEQQGLDGMMSEMSIHDKSRRLDQSIGSRSQTPGSKSSQSSSRSQASEMQHQRNVVNPQERARGMTPPNYPPREHYPGHEQVPAAGQQFLDWQQGRHKRPMRLPELDTQQRLYQQPRGGAYHSASAPPSNAYDREGSYTWDSRNQQDMSADAHRAPTRNNEWGNVANGPSRKGIREQDNRWPQAAVTSAERPMAATRARSDDAQYSQGQMRSGASDMAQSRGPHSKDPSVGDFLETYYESPTGSHEPAGSLRHQPQRAFRQPKEEEMPNFEAMDSGPSGHRRGTSIDYHLPMASHGTVQQSPIHQTSAQGPASNGLNQRSNFAAQAHRSRSQPNLRKQAAAGQPSLGSSGQAPIFEMVGDIPKVPPVPTHTGTAGTGQVDPSQHDSEKIPHHGQRSYPQWQHPGPTPESQAYAQFDFNTPSLLDSQNERAYPDFQHDPRPGMNAERIPSDVAPSRSNSAGNPPTNPDALPEHPTPIRPGLMSKPLANQPGKPPPMRQYTINNSAPPLSNPVALPTTVVEQERRQPLPVSHGELESLQKAVKANPSDRKIQLLLAKKLAEAAVVLADNGGRADPKTRNKNREKYVMEAYKLAKKLVSSGYPEAMFYLADCYGTGQLGLEKDPKEAFNLYQSAAKAGHAQSAYRTAVCCEMGQEGGGGTRKDPLKAIQWYKKAASFGDTPAMYKMGMILLNGLLGQQKNTREAVVWLRRAADRADEENPHALHELALLYESGSIDEKTPHDEEYSKGLFMKAAELGYKFSQFRLGSAYEYGLMGCPVDPRRSIGWYSKAAVRGEHQSELALSGWYLTGSEGVLQQNDTEAYLWARRAAQAGLAKAEYAMGYFTEVGIGAPANVEEAKRWYRRAAGQNFPKARERLNELMKAGAKIQKRERISRSKVSKQNEGECVMM